MYKSGKIINYYYEETITTGLIERACQSTYTWLKRFVGAQRCEVVLQHLGSKTLLACLGKLAMSFLMTVQTDLSPKSLTPVLISLYDENETAEKHQTVDTGKLHAATDFVNHHHWNKHRNAVDRERNLCQA